MIWLAFWIRRFLHLGAALASEIQHGFYTHFHKSFLYPLILCTFQLEKKRFLYYPLSILKNNILFLKSFLQEGTVMEGNRMLSQTL